MTLDGDDFELFGVPRRFQQDGAALDARWRALQADVHPDRFASAGASAQRQAMQWSVRVNEAYRRLKQPLQRAAYLCELNGVSIGAENNTAMPTGFLMQQMAWRESLDDAADAKSVEQLADEVAQHHDAAMAQLAMALSDTDTAPDFVAAAQQIRALMFVERFADDVDRRQRRLEGLEA